MRRRAFIHGGLLLGLAVATQLVSGRAAVAQPQPRSRSRKHAGTDDSPCESGDCDRDYESKHGRGKTLSQTTSYHMRGFGRRSGGLGRRIVRKYGGRRVGSGRKFRPRRR